MQRVCNAIIAGLAFLALTLIATTAVAQSGGNAAAAKLKNPVAASPAAIKAGEQLYQKYCRFCHGADAKGDGPMAPKDSHPPNLIDAEWEFGGTDGDIYTTIRNGAGEKSTMKPFKSKMTEQEIWQVVTYLRSLSPTTTPKSH